MCQGPGGTKIVAELGRYAPMWLSQLPELTDSDEPGSLERLQCQVGNATPERMTREMFSAIEVLAAETSLEPGGLHWADVSILDFLAMLTHRPESEQLLFLGTCRPTDAVMYAHSWRSMVRDLRARRRCDERLLELRSAREAATFLRGPFGDGVADSLLRQGHERIGSGAAGEVREQPTPAPCPVATTR